MNDRIEANKCFFGDCRQLMQNMINMGIQAQTCVTSPPYWGMRDYGEASQIGMEETLHDYLTQIVKVCWLIGQLLKSDGTLWLNIGDGYCGSGKGGNQRPFKNNKSAGVLKPKRDRYPAGMKKKDLMGIPWRVAFALQQSGWYIRSDIIWYQPNPMPESVKDRPTASYEHVFLLSKSERYYYDAESIRERKINPVAQHTRQSKSARKKQKTRGHVKQHNGFAVKWDQMSRQQQQINGCNKKDVWVVPVSNYSGSHFATFPPKLIEPCIIAGSRPGDIVLDPFLGSGTVAEVAQSLGRQWIGCEINTDYQKLQQERTMQVGMAL